MLKLIMKTEVVGMPAVELFQTSWGYAVRYGLETDSHHSLEVAVAKFDSSVWHAMDCSGQFEIEEKDD